MTGNVQLRRGESILATSDQNEAQKRIEEAENMVNGLHEKCQQVNWTMDETEVKLSRLQEKCHKINLEAESKIKCVQEKCQQLQLEMKRKTLGHSLYLGLFVGIIAVGLYFVLTANAGAQSDQIDQLMSELKQLKLTVDQLSSTTDHEHQKHIDSVVAQLHDDVNKIKQHTNIRSLFP